MTSKINTNSSAFDIQKLEEDLEKLKHRKECTSGIQNSFSLIKHGDKSIFVLLARELLSTPTTSESKPSYSYQATINLENDELIDDIKSLFLNYQIACPEESAGVKPFDMIKINEQEIRGSTDFFIKYKELFGKQMFDLFEKDELKSSCTKSYSTDDGKTFSVEMSRVTLSCGNIEGSVQIDVDKAETSLVSQLKFLFLNWHSNLGAYTFGECPSRRMFKYILINGNRIE